MDRVQVGTEGKRTVAVMHPTFRERRPIDLVTRRPAILTVLTFTGRECELNPLIWVTLTQVLNCKICGLTGRHFVLWMHLCGGRRILHNKILTVLGSKKMTCFIHWHRHSKLYPSVQ